MLKILKRLNKKEVLLILLSILIIIFGVWLELKLPEYMANITRLVKTEGSQINAIVNQGMFMLLCAFGSLISAVIVGFLASLISSSFSFRLREKLFNKVIDFSMEEIKMFSPNSLITRTTNDITQIQFFISIGMQMIIRAPILAIWAIMKILNKSMEWTLLTAGATTLMVIYIIIMIIFVLPKFKKVQKAIDNLNGITRENLTGIRVVRSFNAESYQEIKFNEVNQELTNIQTFTQKMMSTLHPVMNFIMYFLTIGIYLIGAILINNAIGIDKMNLFSDMIVFSTYAMMILMSFIMLAMIFVFYPRASVSASRINEVLNTETKIIDGHLEETDSKSDYKLEFNNVSFKYPDAEEYILKNISFKLKEGETLGVIGSTGSGKSTLINLLPRFYDVSEGDILIDGINLKEYKQEYLHKKIGYVPQKAAMFSGTIKNNVTYGDSYSKESMADVKRAIEIAQASDFVEKLDQKYDSHVARGGTNISGGQKQRLSIARAVVRNPEIYLFDDTFSALDYKTELNLRKALNKYTKNATNVIISQRIGTILHADYILVLDKGRLVGFGNHPDLLKNCKIYQEIALSQLSEEELSI